VVANGHERFLDYLLELLLFLSSDFDEDPDDLDVEDEFDLDELPEDLAVDPDEELLPCDTAVPLRCEDVLPDGVLYSGCVLTGAEGRVDAGVVVAFLSAPLSPKFPLFPSGRLLLLFPRLFVFRSFLSKFPLLP
jgi:hypothetical protein